MSHFRRHRHNYLSVVAAILMLAAMFIYVMSDDDSGQSRVLPLPPGSAPPQPAAP